MIQLKVKFTSKYFIKERTFILPSEIKITKM